MCETKDVEQQTERSTASKREEINAYNEPYQRGKGTIKEIIGKYTK